MSQQQAKSEAGEYWQANDLVFCTALGTPLNPNKVLERFKTVLKRACLPDIRFHDLRHRAATMLLAMGVRPMVVQDLLRHNEISMTLATYSQFLPILHPEAVGE